MIRSGVCEGASAAPTAPIDKGSGSGRQADDGRDPDRGHDLRELRRAQREGAAPPGRRERGQRQLRHREGHRDLRPGPGRGGPPDGDHRAGGLRGAVGDRDAADRGHDLRELRGTQRKGPAQRARRAARRRQSRHREGHGGVPGRPDEPRRAGGGRAAGRLHSSRAGPPHGRRRAPGRRLRRGRGGQGRRSRRPRPPRRLPAPAPQGRRGRGAVDARLPGQHGLCLRARRFSPTAGCCGRWPRRCSSGWGASSTAPPWPRPVTAARPWTRWSHWARRRPTSTAPPASSSPASSTTTAWARPCTSTRPRSSSPSSCWAACSRRAPRARPARPSAR